MSIPSTEGICTIPSLGPDVLAVFSTRKYSSLQRGSFLKDLGISESSFYKVKQVHSSKVVNLSRDLIDTAGIEADALVTDRPGAAIGILTADCIPAFFWDPVKRVIGLAHAGWRGLYGGVLENTVEAMRAHYGCCPEDLRAVFGPSNRVCCYEVGEEFLGYFPEHSRKVKDRWHTDLIANAKDRLLEAGLTETHLSDVLICTACRNDQFYSARKEKTAERILSVLMIRPSKMV